LYRPSDSSGALYGTTNKIGEPVCQRECGTVFRLAPPTDGSSDWSFTTLHKLLGFADGPLTAAPGGALYGVGGSAQGGGTVFKLTPPATPPGAWTVQVLHRFNNVQRDGFSPNTPLLLSADGVLYGTTEYGGDGTSAYTGNGTVFEITP
jgi:hypothetical protein